MEKYLWQQRDWPTFRWKTELLAAALSQVRLKQGQLLGEMRGLGYRTKLEAELETLSRDAVKTSEIEGERLDKDQVRSSVADRLGIAIGGTPNTDRHIDGLVAMMVDATHAHQKPLTKKRLWGWHAGLFPVGYSGIHKIRAGKWRDDKAGPMEVVSGPIGRQKIHYQAPPAKRVDTEMKRFFDWFNTDDALEPLLKAGLAHLWFLTIHPFEDGNGRIARAIADMALCRSEANSQRFYSMSSQIRLECKAYYAVLERAQKGTLEATEWLLWFIQCLERAVESAQTTLHEVFGRARVWERAKKISLNLRQRLMIKKLTEDFQGKLTTSKWARIAKCSQDTAHRDIVELLDARVLVKEIGGGRSTSYALAKI